MRSAVRPTDICCVRADFDVNYNTKGKETLFSKACAAGHTHIVHYLVAEVGANIAECCASKPLNGTTVLGQDWCPHVVNAGSDRVCIGLDRAIFFGRLQLLYMTCWLHLLRLGTKGCRPSSKGRLECVCHNDCVCHFNLCD